MYKYANVDITMYNIIIKYYIYMIKKLWWNKHFVYDIIIYNKKETFLLQNFKNKITFLKNVDHYCGSY